MSNLKSPKKPQFDLSWQTNLSDYVTAIAWSPNGVFLAASDGAGEICIFNPSTQAQIELQEKQGASVDCLLFNSNGHFLAAAGQNGRISLWKVGATDLELVNTLENPAWIDRMAWRPGNYQLAFNFGFYTQIFEVKSSTVVETLKLDGAAQDLKWHPNGKLLAIALQNRIEIWNAQTWEQEKCLELTAPSQAIAWSPNGQFIASGNMNRTLMVWEWGNESPWQMQGFPGKVRQIVWSEGNSPLLISSSVEGIVTWTKDPDERVGWNPTILNFHQETVQAIAFQPKTRLLASAAEDGLICLWYQAKALSSVLEGAVGGFSTLSWHPQGNKLAAGSSQGELLIWSSSMAGQGFGR